MEKTIGKQLQDSSFIKEYADTGRCYKNYENFENKQGVCYISQDTEEHYTYQDFVNLCGGNEEIARQLFNMVDWNTPESEIQVGLEIVGVFPCTKCSYFYNLNTLSNCPKCGVTYQIDI